MEGRTSFLFVLCIIALPVRNTTLIRQRDYRSGVFVLSRPGYILRGYSYVQLLVQNIIECGNACLRNDKCQSYNCGNTADADGKYICQLNNGIAGVGSYQWDLVLNKEFSYYEEPQLPQSQKCHESLCQNGGTCKITARGYFDRCVCATYFTGKYCDICKARDCKEIYKMGGTVDGIYPIDPDGQGIIQVVCDQTTDGGGWIVIQQRENPFDTNFFVNWTTYEEGFGNISSEFWLGNKAIHRITKLPNKQLCIHLKSKTKEGLAKYENFTVSSSSDNYRIEYHVFHDNQAVGNAMQNNNGQMFSTFDRDNDANQFQNCANVRKSAWWYDSSCGHSDLNQNKPLWDTWFDYLKTSQCTMKIR